ncbi:hypothetical protein [Burkholderia sp. 22PA0106]|uniref:hypothetical protein n=1 Tax=Burkholderia sp. 22PA0106 TaxID=3237371 RepID=UPI0039C003B0
MLNFFTYCGMTMGNHSFSDGPAIAIGAENTAFGDDAGEKPGVAYIGFGENQGVGEKASNTEVLPPLDLSAISWAGHIVRR